MSKLFKYFFFLLIAFRFGHTATSQELSYINYNVKDGLAGSTVYDMCQDKDGFLWFATENGLSRFDGAHFKNYTVADGLPDNEVLRVFADSKGRVWAGTFSKQACYYYEGEIYNARNDSMVNKIKLFNSLSTIFETDNGKLVLGDFRKIFEIASDKTVTDLTALPVFRPYPSAAVNVSPNYFDPSYMVSLNDTVFRYYNNKLTFFYKLPLSYSKLYFAAKTYSNGTHKMIKTPEETICQVKFYKSEAVKYIGTTDGAWEVDTTNYVLKQQFLKGKKIAGILEDTEGNVWFASMGEGVFKLPSKEIVNYLFNVKEESANIEVYSLEFQNRVLFTGLGFSTVALVNPFETKKKKYLLNEFRKFENRIANNRLYCSHSLPDGKIMLGFDHFLVKKEGNAFLLNQAIKPVKSIALINEEHLLTGTSLYAFKIRIKDLSIVDTIWRERCTEVFYREGFYYIGTLNGLYKVNESTKAYQYLGAFHPALTRRITDIKLTADGTMWIATNDAGVIAMRNDQFIQISAEGNKISSNICKTLFADGNDLWIGTNKGLTKLSVSVTDTSVIRYSTSDGLPSDIVNAVYKTDSVIWVGSPAGLSRFSEKDISGFSVCRLKMVNVNVSGRDEWPKDSYTLSYRQSGISFDYAGISMKSAGDIVYHYFLEGFDKNWNQTRENNLNYQSLPPGNYTLKLMAVNKFGVKSNMIEIAITVSTPFWKAVWFWVLCFTILSLSAGFLIYRRNKNFRKKLEEKSRVERQFAELEQQALQAQMNPHFIFNCLNAIQQFIVTNDKESANKYLTGFASLVRQTLDNSQRKTITLSEEAEYLRKYLEMEKMRSGGKFEYSIETDPQLNADYVQLPALLLQPYAENSLRHGINYLQDASGKLEISFLLKGNMVNCQVKDNGIGRKKSAELKSKQHITYESKGIGLTEKRVMLLNKNRRDKISIEITDLTDKEGNPAGTNVIVKIPVAYEPETEKHYS